MPIRIAIPMPHSRDREYSERAIPQYERAIALVGGEAIRIPLDQGAGKVRDLAATCAAVLLPGSNADVDPARFGQPRSAHTADADPRRDEVDALLLDNAYAQRKPVLGICYGLQSLNVYRKGNLVQHIPDFLPEATRSKINHEAGRNVAVAHMVHIVPDSLLADILRGDNPREDGGIHPSRETESSIRSLAVNSSHHQSADAIGDGLRIISRCPDDGIIEALEGTSPEHFVLAVQWHPERSVDHDPASRAIFESLISAARVSV